MKSQKQLKEKHNRRISEYRSRPDRERLELVVPPELAERFRQLPGLDGKTNAQKLDALCHFWLQKQQSTGTSLDAQVIPVSRPSADTGIKNQPKPLASTKGSAGLDLEAVDQALKAFGEELAQEDAAEASDLAPSLEPSPTRRDQLAQAVRSFKRALDTPEQRRRRFQHSKTADTWARVLRDEPLTAHALQQLHHLSPDLADLMTTGQALNYVTPRDVTALLALAGDDRIQMLLYFIKHGCSDQAELHLGELGQRFRAAWLQQPERTPQSWKIKPASRRRPADGPPKDESNYKRDMLSAIEALYERLYPKDTKPGNTSAAQTRKQIPAIAELRHTPYHKLYQLLVAGLLPVSDSELQTLSGLEPEARRLALWTLVHSRTQDA